MRSLTGAGSNRQRPCPLVWRAAGGCGLLEFSLTARRGWRGYEVVVKETDSISEALLQSEAL